MKKHLLIFLATVALIFGFAFTANQDTTHASSTIPVSMRGHFYNADSNSHMTLTARYVKLAGHLHHVRYVGKSGSWDVAHFTHGYPIYLKYNPYSEHLHVVYGMSIHVTFNRL